MSEKQPAPRLHIGSLKLAEYVFQTYVADIPSGTKPEVVAQPDYWSHFVGQNPMIKDGDMIICRWVDGTREEWHRVLFTSKLGAKLSLVLEIEHEPAGDESGDTYEVKYKGFGTKWVVSRKDNGAILKDKFQAKSEASSFLAHHLREMGQ